MINSYNKKQLIIKNASKQECKFIQLCARGHTKLKELCNTQYVSHPMLSPQ